MGDDFESAFSAVVRGNCVECCAVTAPSESLATPRAIDAVAGAKAVDGACALECCSPAATVLQKTTNSEATGASEVWFSPRVRQVCRQAD